MIKRLAVVTDVAELIKLRKQTNMYTKPEFRHRGIATELLNAVIDEAKSRRYKVIRLHTSEYGKSIYKKAGFTDSDGYMALRV